MGRRKSPDAIGRRFKTDGENLVDVGRMLAEDGLTEGRRKHLKRRLREISEGSGIMAEADPETAKAIKRARAVFWGRGKKRIVKADE